MHFTGQETINVPMQAVWDFFMDPHRVAECAPGFQSMEVLAPDHFKPRVGVGIGAIKATFTLDVQLANLRPIDHAEVKGHGIAAGSAVDFSGFMDLATEAENVTKMDWTADVIVSGGIASVGGRLLEHTARKLTARFFANMRENIDKASSTARA